MPAFPARSTARDDGADTLATSGTRAAAAFWTISKLARPLTARRAGPEPFAPGPASPRRSSAPTALSTALWRPTSSAEERSAPSAAKRPAAWRPPVRAKMGASANSTPSMPALTQIERRSTSVHLFAAMAQGTGVIVAQTQVDEKSNEITAFAPVLKGLDLQGALVTADAMHTQVEHARHLVEDRHADYLFQVKANQPNLLAALRSIPETDWSQEHTTTTRGHGRLDHRHVQVAALPESVTFPHAAQAIRVYRERADLTDSLISDETSYYITSVTPERADPDRLGTHIRGHWGIENKIHWVRDWAYDEDRHQLRAPGTLAQTLATLRNLAISILRLQGATNITATLRWIARDPTRAVTLIGC